MNTGVESADSPDRRKPGKHKSPPTGPESKVLNVGEDVACTVSIVTATNGQCNDRREDENKVHNDKDGLQFAHNAC